MILRLFDYDGIDKREIKFGFYMAIHHPFDHRGKFAFGQIKYSLRIIMRKLCVCESNDKDFSPSPYRSGTSRGYK